MYFVYNLNDIRLEVFAIQFKRETSYSYFFPVEPQKNATKVIMYIHFFLVELHYLVVLQVGS